MKKKQKRQTRKEPVVARAKKATKSAKRTKELAYSTVNRPASDSRKSTASRVHPSPVMKGRAKKKPQREESLLW